MVTPGRSIYAEGLASEKAEACGWVLEMAW